MGNVRQTAPDQGARPRLHRLQAARGTQALPISNTLTRLRFGKMRSTDAQFE